MSIQAKIQLNRIEEFFINGDYKEVSPQEAIGFIENIIPARVQYIEKEPVTPKEKLEYMRLWRLEQKKIQKIKEKEDKERTKINNALKRDKFMCFNCKKSVIVDPEKNKHLIEFKKNRLKKNLIIENECSECSTKLRAFAGFL